MKANLAFVFVFYTSFAGTYFIFGILNIKTYRLDD